MERTEGISPKQFHEAEGVDDWRVLSEGACAYFRTGSFAAGARLARAIGELDGLDGHHPDLDVRHPGVTVRLITVTDDDYGLSGRDLDLARRISAVARQLGFPMATASESLRDRLLQVTTQVLAEQGVAAVSLREIARRAGVSHGAPLRHFPSLAILPDEPNLVFLRAAALLASHPTWEVIIRSFAAKGLLRLPAATSIDAMIG